MTAPPPAPVRTAPAAAPSTQLHREMGFRDLLLFYLVTGFTVRWVGNAAAAGPSAIVIWIGAGLVFYLPLMFTVHPSLKANNARYEMHMYPNTQHGFHNDTTPRYDEKAAKLAWQRTVDFFNRHLRG